MRAYLQEQQEQKQKEAVSTIEDRVKMWLQIRRAVAAELEAEVFSTASESGSESFGIHSDSDLRCGRGAVAKLAGLNLCSLSRCSRCAATSISSWRRRRRPS